MRPRLSAIASSGVRGLIVTNFNRTSALMSDNNAICRRIGPEFAPHDFVSHTNNQLAKADKKHSNTAENCVPIFRRGVIGTYHHMSEARLGRYGAGFDLRHNTRNTSDGERAAVILQGDIGRCLTYRRTDKLAA